MGEQSVEKSRYETCNVQNSARVREALWGGEGSDGRVSLGSKRPREELRGVARLGMSVEAAEREVLLISA